MARRKTKPRPWFRSFASTPTTNPNVANTSFTPILSFAQPQNNHNGGWLGFSPNDHYIYVASGDGGNRNDNGAGHTAGTGNAQDVTSNLLGKMLRIDVDRDSFPADANRNYAIPPTNPLVGISGDDEIWAYGLRNPFRNSFDRITGDLWIGDVGQDNREEIDFQPGTSRGGENYGWRLREGDIATPVVGGNAPANYVPPVHTYTHPDTTVPPESPIGFNGVSVTGGYVYRGPDPSLQGKYFFLDSRNTPGASDDNYWMASTAPFGSVTNINNLLTPNVGSPQFPVSFGEDAVGNLYIVYLVSGDIYRIQTSQTIPGDMNADGGVLQTDFAKWASGFGGATTAGDANEDGVVDGADYVMWRKNLGGLVRQIGDYDVDGNHDAVDYVYWTNTFGATTGDRVTDGNGDGVVDGADYVAWRKHFDAAGLKFQPTNITSLPEPSTTFFGLAIVYCGRRLRRRFRATIR